MADDAIYSAQLQKIAEVIGVAAALRLADAIGGQDQCSVPKTPRPGHPWVAVIGWEAFGRLCAHYGGGRIDIPRNFFGKTAKAKMVDLKRQGLSHRAIARELRCTERWVRMVMNPKEDERQTSLPV